MAVFRATSEKQPIQIASSENQFLSTSLYAADDIPEQDRLKVSVLQGEDKTGNLIKKALEFPQAVYNTRSELGFLAVFRNNVHFVYQGSLTNLESIDQGLVSNDINLTFGIFNAFVSTEIIESLSVTSSQGVTITSPSNGQVLNPLEEIEMIIVVEEDGPAIIDATISLKLENRPEVYQFFISGNRTIVFPFRPETPYNENNEWLNNIQTSLTGKEIRTSLRAAPRRSVDLSVKIGSVEEKIYFDNLMTSKQGKYFAVPSWGELSKPGYPIQSTDTEIFIDTANLSYRVDESVIIWESYDNNKILKVVNILPDRLVLSSDVGEDFSEDAIVMPVYSGPTEKSVNVSEFISEAIYTDVGFEFLKEQSIDTYTPELEFESVPVMLEDSIVNGFSRLMKLNSPYSKLDYGMGDFLTFSLREFNTRGYTHGIVANSRADIWKLREFIHWCSGANKTFWLSTMTRVAEAYEDIDINDTTIKVKKSNITSNMLGSLTRNVLMVSYPGGCYIANITDITETDDYEEYTLDTPAPLTILKEEAGLSYLVRARIERERIAFEWIDPEQVECKLSLLEVDE